MKYRLIPVLFAVVLGTHVASSQDFDYGSEAVSIVSQFMKLEIEGGRINAEGWRGAGNHFFLHPERPPEMQVVHVVSRKYYVTLVTLAATGDVTVAASFPVCQGTVDTKLFFELPDAHANKGISVLAGCSESYKLEYSPRYW